MGLIYKELKNFIKEIDNRNKEEIQGIELMGVNINKEFMPSVANIVGTDLSKYKIVDKGQFACNLMHIGRDEVLPIALNNFEKSIIVSPAYCTFEIIDSDELLPEFLMLCFRKSYMDHLLWFKSDSSVRGGISFKDISEIKIPYLPILEQKKIIRQYNNIKDRIEVLNKNITQIEMAIKLQFKNCFEKYSQCDYEEKKLSDVFYFQEGPGIRNWQNVDKDGINYINIRCIQNNDIVLENPNMISVEEASSKYKHFLLNEDDFVISTSGTLGKYAVVRKEHLPLCLNTSIIRFMPKDKDAYMFMYGYLTSDYFKEILETEANGCAQVNFGPTHLNKIAIKYPLKEVIIELKNNTEDMLKYILEQKREIQNLYNLLNCVLFAFEREE